MSYSKLYFDKELESLSFADIEKYFSTEKEESDKIEYKSHRDSGLSREKINYEKIFSSICAMLNSEGGIIVWGAPEGVTKSKTDNKKIFIGALTPFSMELEKDFFVNKVTDNITPSPRGINIKAIAGGGKYVHVIEIEKSMYAPHQFDDRYFMRLDGQTRRAPHHYIEALMKRIAFPRLECYVKLQDFTIRNDYKAKDGSKQINFELAYFILNQSRFMNEHDVFCRLILAYCYFRDVYNQGTKVFRSDGEMIKRPITNILFNGHPESHSEPVVIPNIKSNEPFDIQILLSTGGKASPLIYSFYKFTIKPDIENLTVDVSIKRQDENIYFHELPERIGISEAAATAKLLGR
jgi:hypothetical protein